MKEMSESFLILTVAACVSIKTLAQMTADRVAAAAKGVFAATSTSHNLRHSAARGTGTETPSR